MSKKTEEQDVNAEKKTKKFVILSAVLVVAILVAVIIFLLPKMQEGEAKRNVVVTRDNIEEVADDMMNRDYIEPGYYSTSMSTTWHFATGDAISEDAYVANVEENTSDIYFDVFLADDENEAILKSPILPRGSELDNIALDVQLSAGTYDCVMVYHLVDEEQNTKSTLRVRFTIVVEG